jgi:hypothetical protein
MSQALTIARGKYDRAKLEAALEDMAKKGTVKIHKDGEVRVYEGKDGAGETVFFAFADKDTLLAASTQGPVANAAKNGGKKEPALKKELKTAVEKADGKASAWMAGVIPDKVKRGMAASPQTKEVADKLQAFSGSAVASDDLEMVIGLHTPDEDSAKSLAKTAGSQEAKLIIGLLVGERLRQVSPELGTLATEMITKMETGNDKSIATLTSKMSAAEIEKALKKEK